MSTSPISRLRARRFRATQTSSGKVVIVVVGRGRLQAERNSFVDERSGEAKALMNQIEKAALKS